MWKEESAGGSNASENKNEVVWVYVKKKGAAFCFWFIVFVKLLIPGPSREVWPTSWNIGHNDNHYIKIFAYCLTHIDDTNVLQNQMVGVNDTKGTWRYLLSNP
jgi:hypothetical protein